MASREDLRRNYMMYTVTQELIRAPESSIGPEEHLNNLELDAAILRELPHQLLEALSSLSVLNK